MSQPQEPPPSYALATGSSTASQPARTPHLEVPGQNNAIPTQSRRSMEDEQRPLPDGWVRQFDAKEQHQFFVDTKANPPRSIWHHPYDDDDFLSTLSTEEREKIQEQGYERDAKKPTSEKSDQTDAKNRPIPETSSTFGAGPELPPRPSVSTGKSSDGRKDPLGRRLKDKITGQTHEERVQERLRREQEERQYYEAHVRFRQAMQRAQMTGQPQFFARDENGREIYIEPPTGMGMRGYPGAGYGYNPYQSGPYANPNARFIRPGGPYNRPYGSGYGGGMGMPIAGGLLGGMLLGGLLF